MLQYTINIKLWATRSQSNATIAELPKIMEAWASAGGIVTVTSFFS